jgi:Histidine kinase-, DNA gyrase B-, and HSP90-like ATPase
VTLRPSAVVPASALPPASDCCPAEDRGLQSVVIVVRLIPIFGCFERDDAEPGCSCLSKRPEVSKPQIGPWTEEIFEAFVTTKKTGLGIGLAVSRLITEAHGGRLWAENNPSGGATFCLALPLNSRSQLSTANGHIHQDYLKVDGEWKITRSHTSRLFVDEQWL